MAVRVVKVERRANMGWFQRTYLPAIAKGLATTSRLFFRNLAGHLSGNPPEILVQYPEQRVDYADAFRGMPVLVALEDGLPKCVACGLCEFACPTDCITIVPGELPERGIERYPDAFDIDMSRCMFCGLCEEACPEEAIVMSREVELGAYDRRNTIFRKDDLLVPEPMLKRRLEFLRAEYDREHAPARAAGPEAPAESESLMDDFGSAALRRLLGEVPDAVLATHADHGDATAQVDAARIVEVMRLLRDDPETSFEMLADLTAVDYLGETPRFEVVYHLYSIEKNHRVRVKTRVAEEPAQIDSIVDIWPGANWMEREVWDLYGIRFRNHPDLRRILLYEEFEGHPLRKDYPKERRQPLVGPRN